jgi:hypothetical protein
MSIAIDLVAGVLLFAAGPKGLARFAAKRRGVRLAELLLAASALACLPGQQHEHAQKTLLRLL